MILKVLDKKGRKDSLDDPAVAEAIEAHNIAKLKAMDAAEKASRRK